MDLRISTFPGTAKIVKTGPAHRLNKTSASAEVYTQRDAVTFSGAAGDYQTIRRALAFVPDVRAELTASVRDRISSGNYAVTPADVADKILQTV